MLKLPSKTDKYFSETILTAINDGDEITLLTCLTNWSGAAAYLQKNGTELLNRAINANKIKVLTLLLKHGARQVDEDTIYPLHLAIQRNYNQAVTILISDLVIQPCYEQFQKIAILRISWAYFFTKPGLSYTIFKALAVNLKKVSEEGEDLSALIGMVIQHSTDDDPNMPRTDMGKLKDRIDFLLQQGYSFNISDEIIQEAISKINQEDDRAKVTALLQNCLTRIRPADTESKSPIIEVEKKVAPAPKALTTRSWSFDDFYKKAFELDFKEVTDLLNKYPQLQSELTASEREQLVRTLKPAMQRFLRKRHVLVVGEPIKPSLKPVPTSTVAPVSETKPKKETLKTAPVAVPKPVTATPALETKPTSKVSVVKAALSSKVLTEEQKQEKYLRKKAKRYEKQSKLRRKKLTKSSVTRPKSCESASVPKTVETSHAPIAASSPAAPEVAPPLPPAKNSPVLVHREVWPKISANFDPPPFTSTTSKSTPSKSSSTTPKQDFRLLEMGDAETQFLYAQHCEAKGDLKEAWKYCGFAARQWWPGAKSMRARLQDAHPSLVETSTQESKRTDLGLVATSAAPASTTPATYTSIITSTASSPTFLKPASEVAPPIATPSTHSLSTMLVSHTAATLMAQLKLLETTSTSDENKHHAALRSHLETWLSIYVTPKREEKETLLLTAERPSASATAPSFRSQD